MNVGFPQEDCEEYSPHLFLIRSVAPTSDRDDLLPPKEGAGVGKVHEVVVPEYHLRSTGYVGGL